MRLVVWDLRPVTVDRARRREGIFVASWGWIFSCAHNRNGKHPGYSPAVNAAEKPLAHTIATEASCAHNRNGGILLTCFASCEVGAAEALAPCEVGAAGALLRMAAAEETSCEVGAAEE